VTPCPHWRPAPAMRPRAALSNPQQQHDRAKAFRACVFVREERETKTAKSRQWSSFRSGDQNGPWMFLKQLDSVLIRRSDDPKILRS